MKKQPRTKFKFRAYYKDGSIIEQTRFYKSLTNAVRAQQRCYFDDGFKDWNPNRKLMDFIIISSEEYGRQAFPYDCEPINVITEA